MIMRFILSLFLIISFNLNAITPSDSRPTYTRDKTNFLDGGDLCPKDDPTKYGHHLVLVDATTRLNTVQIELVERLILSREHLDQIAPWDRLTIMMLYGEAPSKNKPIFSKCRPRSGNPSYHKVDAVNKWVETEKDLKVVYEQLFIGGVKKAMNTIADPQQPEGGMTNFGSPILGQIKEISRLPDILFTPDSGYESRKLTIVSDLAQNTKKIPFYDLCKKKCPTWDKVKNNKKYKLWIKQSMPKFGEDIPVNVLYLNSNFDKNIDNGILDFWMDYFEEAGITNFNFDIETEYVAFETE
jgi:hypothetical protein